jgi:hypothetical protein
LLAKETGNSKAGFEFKPPKVEEANTYKVPPEKATPSKVITVSGAGEFKLHRVPAATEP